MEIYLLPFSTSPTKSSLHRRLYKCDELPNPSKAITARHGPRRKQHCWTQIVSVGTCFLLKALHSNGCLYMLIKNLLPKHRMSFHCLFRGRCPVRDLHTTISTKLNGIISQKDGWNVRKTFSAYVKSIWRHYLSNSTWRLLGLFLDPENRRNMLLRNVGLSPNYAALHPIVRYFSELPLWEPQTQLIFSCHLSSIVKELKLYPVLSGLLLFGRIKVQIHHAQSGCALVSPSPKCETCDIKFRSGKEDNEVSVNAAWQCLSWKTVEIISCILCLILYVTGNMFWVLSTRTLQSFKEIQFQCAVAR
jgi:hypothetical protein